MTELLAPAGNMEALKAAISKGCDAVYLGMQKFGARAYSDNFDIESLKEAVKYAHIREVKIYVTMNTIVFEDEIEDMKTLLHQLNEMGVDGVDGAADLSLKADGVAILMFFQPVQAFLMGQTGKKSCCFLYLLHHFIIDFRFLLGQFQSDNIHLTLTPLFRS